MRRPGAVPPGAVAWYVTGRFYAAGDGTVQDVGYFLHLAGLEGALFDGPPGEAAARLTFAAHPFRAGSLANGDLRLALDEIGEFGVYLRDRPGAAWDDPRSFAAGEEVARFRRASVVVGLGIAAGEWSLSSNLFTAELVASRPFELAGRRTDVAELLPHGVTQWGTAGGRALPPPAGFSSALPFVGSAVAVGAPLPPRALS